MKKHSLIAMVFFVVLNCQAQFEWITPKPSGNHIYSLLFANASNGVSGGENGTLSYTSDGGLTWKLVMTGTSEDVTDIKYIDGTYYAAKKDLWVSQDGINWQKRSNYPGIEFATISFVDSQHGFAFVYSQLNTNFGTTNDGGKTWDFHTIDINHYIPNKGYRYEKIHFTSQTNGYLKTHTGVYKTLDGGSSWVPILYHYDEVYIEDMCVVHDSLIIVSQYNPGSLGDPTIGWISTSTNQGDTWQRTNFEDQIPNNIYFVNNSTGYITCYVDDNKSQRYPDNMLFKTTDGGKTWTQNTLPENTNFSITSIDTSSIFLYGWHGDIWLSNNSGSSWNLLGHSKEKEFDFLTLAGDSNLIAVKNLEDSCAFYKSIDKGRTWVNISKLDTFCLEYFTFVDSLNAAVCGETPNGSGQGKIVTTYYTTDGAASWHRNQWESTHSQTYFYNPQIIDSGILIARSSMEDSMWISNNYGQTWEKRYAPISSGNLTFVNADTGYVYLKDEVYNRVIYHTTFDGGHTWNYYELWINSDLTQLDKTVFLRDGTIVWVFKGKKQLFSDYFFTIYASGDCGQTWTYSLDYMNCYSVNALSFHTSGKGRILFSDGNGLTSMNSPDGGKTWHHDNFYHANFYNTISFSDGSTLFHSEAKLFLFESSLNPSGIGDYNIRRKSTITISPNPAGHYIKIINIYKNYKTADIEIYDQMGRLVAQKKYHPNSSYETNFEICISHLNGGLYFCRVVIDNELFSGEFVKL